MGAREEGGWLTGGGRAQDLGWGSPLCPHLASSGPLTTALAHSGPQDSEATGKGGTPTWHIQFVSLRAGD